MVIDDTLAIFFATPLHFRLFVNDGRDALAAFLGCRVADDWPIFDDAPAQALAAPPEAQRAPWGSWCGIDLETRTLMALGGFGGAPDADGAVMFGYALARDWRGRGWGTRYAALLVRIAFADPAVRRIDAHTLQEGVISPEGFDNRASVAVLRRLGFVGVGRASEDGMEVLRWSLERST